MEECVPLNYKEEALDIMHAKGFFEMLPPMDGALEALKNMEAVKTSHAVETLKRTYVLLNNKNIINIFEISHFFICAQIHLHSIQ